MEKAPKKHMGLLYVALSALFLFKPTVALIDVLPDVVGYLLLFVGVARLSDLSERILDAAGRFRIMIFVGVGEILAWYLIHVAMNDRLGEMNRYEQPVAVLLFAFVFLVLRCWFLIPAFRDLFTGLDALAERFDADALSGNDGKRRSRLDATRRATVRFVILQSVLSVLPELSVLTSFEIEAGNQLIRFDWYRFITLFRSVALLISAVVGILWLIGFLRLFKKVLGQNAWLERIHTHYCREILTQTVMLRMRRVRIARLLLCIGLPFAASLRIGGISMLPGAVFAIFVLIALDTLGDLFPAQKPCRRAAWCLIVVSVLQQIANRTYLQRYYPEAALYQTDAFYRFLLIRVFSVAEAGLTLLLLFLLFERLFDTIKLHTEVNYGTPESTSLSRSATERLHGTLTKKLKLCAILFSLSALLIVADIVLQLHVSWMWQIALILSIVAIWNTVTFLQELTLQIQYRYQSNAGYKRD